MTRTDEMAGRNRRVGLVVGGVVCLMIGLSFAAVPLYNLFCRVTGYGGTTQRVDGAADHVVDRQVTVRFNGAVDAGLPWDFAPEVRSMTLNVGEAGNMAYVAHNRANSGTTGMAIYNVTPFRVGQYFNKIQCFCFDEQHLAAGQYVNMPVFFYIDPAFADDPEMADVNTITLHYTFYSAEEEHAAAPAGDDDAG